MKDNNMKRVVIVYLIMIPVMVLLTEFLWGALHGALGGLKIGKLLQDPQKSKELTDFMKKHGFNEEMSKEEASSFMEKLSPKDKAEFQDILFKSIKKEDLINFKTASAACALIFGAVGFTSGALTKTWQSVGFLLIVSFLLNNPIMRFGAINKIPMTQKAIIILSQFVAAYVFAFLGAYLCNAAAKRKQIKTENGP